MSGKWTCAYNSKNGKISTVSLKKIILLTLTNTIKTLRTIIINQN